MGLLVRGGGEETLEPVLELFPVLRERLRQRAGTLSGGEQQMLATARALCARPTLLLMDEPSEGLMPILVDRLLGTVATLRAQGVGILLVEQKVDAVLRVADRVALIEQWPHRARGHAGRARQRSPTSCCATSACGGSRNGTPGG